MKITAINGSAHGKDGVTNIGLDHRFGHSVKPAISAPVDLGRP